MRPHMTKGVSHTHEISQNKLKGRPRTMGYPRSQSDTEKHTVVKGSVGQGVQGEKTVVGSNPHRITSLDGLLRSELPFHYIIRLCSGLIEGR